MSVPNPTLDGLKIDRTTAAPQRSAPWLALVVAGALLLAGVAGWQLLRPGAPRPVATTTVREAATPRGQRTVLNASGYVVARREATVSSKVTGRVVEVMIEEGMRVKEGQVLARLDASNVSANLEMARAQTRATEAALQETQVRLAEAGKEWRRVADLARDRIATAADLDRAEAEVNSLKARLTRQGEDTEVLRRQVAIWELQLDDMVIRAPFSGVVTSKNAQPGEMISPVSAGGGFTRTGICTIVDMDSLEIEIDVNESYINRVVPGQGVEGTLDAYPEWKIPCKVLAIVPTADRQKATVRVRVAFDQLEARILPQMGVKVAFRDGAEGAGAPLPAVLVPKTAVRRLDGRDFVFVVADGKVERRAVTLGGEAGADVIVLAGAAAGERVIAEPAAEVEPGGRVREQNP
jgi:RND family efflux transporter MFP subunit